MDAPDSTLRLRLFVLAAAAILMITMGIRMSLGLFVPPLRAQTALTITQISFAMALTQLLWGVSQPVAGALADRFGARKVMHAGTLLLALGCLLMPLMPTATGLAFTVGVLIAFGAGAGSFSILIGQISRHLPPKMRGTASGVVNAGGSFGQFLFAPLAQSLIAQPAAGWKGAMWVLGALSLLVLPLAQRITRPAPGGAETAAAEPAASGQTLKEAVAAALKNRSYLLLHAGFFTCGFHIAFLATHLPTEIALCGLPSHVASASLALIGLTNVAGSLIAGWCVGRFRSKWILFWMYASRTLLVLAYLAAPRTDTVFYLFAAGLGLTWLATVPPTAAITGKLFGVRYLATLFGLTLLSHQVGAFFGAYLGGWALYAFGDYGWMWYADAALALVAALCNLPIREDKIQAA